MGMGLTGEACRNDINQSSIGTPVGTYIAEDWSVIEELVFDSFLQELLDVFFIVAISYSFSFDSS